MNNWLSLPEQFMSKGRKRAIAMDMILHIMNTMGIENG
jgi:hypothetical protein